MTDRKLKEFICPFCRECSWIYILLRLKLKCRKCTFTVSYKNLSKWWKIGSSIKHEIT